MSHILEKVVHCAEELEHEFEHCVEEMEHSMMATTFAGVDEPKTALECMDPKTPEKE